MQEATNFVSFFHVFSFLLIHLLGRSVVFGLVDLAVAFLSQLIYFLRYSIVCSGTRRLVLWDKSGFPWSSMRFETYYHKQLPKLQLTR